MILRFFSKAAGLVSAPGSGCLFSASKSQLVKEVHCPWRPNRRSGSGAETGARVLALKPAARRFSKRPVWFQRQDQVVFFPPPKVSW